MKRRVLVTGGAGFIGSHVADAFLASGYDVTVIDNLSRGREANVPKAAEFRRLDLGSPEARALVAGGRFDVIAHLAAQVDVRVSVSDPVLDARENLMAFLNLLEGARAGGTRRLVFSSSGGVVYGERKPPHVETTPKLPVSPYGVSKLAAEFYLACYAQLFGLEGAALRYANVYGPRQDPHGEAGVVAIFSERLYEGRGLTVYGNGEQTRDYVFVGDVVGANLALTDAALPSGEGIDARGFNVGTGEETTVNQLAAVMMDVAGRRVDVSYAPARPGELQNSSLNNTRLRSLGWAPATSLREGLRRTYEYIAAQLQA